MLHANLSSELRLFSCAKKLYLRTFNHDTIFGTKEGVVYEPNENYLVHFLVHLPSMAQFWCHTLHRQEFLDDLKKSPKSLKLTNGISTCDSLSP
jgi:hypothetical protein